MRSVALVLLIIAFLYFSTVLSETNVAQEKEWYVSKH